MKRKFYIMMLAAAISMMTAVPVFALPAAVNADSYKWTLENNKWYCKDERGNAVSGFVSYNDEIYYLDKNGIMKTGWVKVSGSWYYLDGEGKLATDEWIDNYYVDGDGKMTKIE